MELGDIFASIEFDLLSGMTHSLADGHWRSNRLRALKEFQTRNRALLEKYNIDKSIRDSIETAYMAAGYKTEDSIRKAVSEGYKTGKSGTSFVVNDKRINLLAQELQGSMKTAKTAVLRTTDDMYRKIMARAEVAMSTNLYPLNKAIDMATKDFLSQGINCIKYKNGAQVNIASYAEMALRTSTRRAGLWADGDVRKSWGESLVYVSQYGACSDTCLPWQGRVYVDDVYSGGKPQEGYPLLSEAIEGGLFHPNCRHKSSVYFPEINNVPSRMDAEKTQKAAELESKQRYNERQIRKYKRLEAGTLEEKTKADYHNKVLTWQSKQRQLIQAHPDILRRDPSREQIKGVYGEKKKPRK